MNTHTLIASRREGDLLRRWGGNAPAIASDDRAWLRRLLYCWANKYRGDLAPSLNQVNIIGRLMFVTHWNDDKAAQILSTLENLTLQGYTGDQLWKKTKEIVCPGGSVEAAITRAKISDDADLIELVLSLCLSDKNPLRFILQKRYLENCSAHLTAVQLARDTQAPIHIARERVKWGEDVLERLVFYHLQQTIGQTQCVDS